MLSAPVSDNLVIIPLFLSQPQVTEIIISLLSDPSTAVLGPAAVAFSEVRGRKE